MLLILFAPQPATPQPGYANLSLAVSDLWPPLNASGPSDAINWTENEFYEYMDEAAKRLARLRGIFIARDTSLSTVAGQGPYTLPTGRIATVQLDVEGQVLKARNVQEIEALDSDWLNTEDTPEAFLLDTQGLEQMTLYPKPADSDIEIGMINQIVPDDITASAALIPVCPCLREFFTFSALAAAMDKETPGSKEEVSPWLRQLVQAYEDTAAGLWGS